MVLAKQACAARRFLNCTIVCHKTP
jgi:hypothetical protein